MSPRACGPSWKPRPRRGYCADSTPISVYVDTTDGDKQYTVTAENYALPDMKITKRDAMSGKPISGTVFSIKSVTGSYSTSVTTGTDGSATLSAIPAGVYVVREESVPEPYIVTNTEQTVALRPGKTSEVTFVDYEKPGLEIIKKNIANGEPIEGVTYRIEPRSTAAFLPAPRPITMGGFSSTLFLLAHSK